MLQPPLKVISKIENVEGLKNFEAVFADCMVRVSGGQKTRIRLEALRAYVEMSAGLTPQIANDYFNQLLLHKMFIKKLSVFLVSIPVFHLGGDLGRV